MRKRRKNYLPTLILTIVLWVFLGLLVFEVEPKLVKNILIPGMYLPFFLFFFPASFLTLAIIWGNSKRGFLSAVGLAGILMLRIYKLGNLLNLILLIGVLLAIEKYID